MYESSFNPWTAPSRNFQNGQYNNQPQQTTLIRVNGLEGAKAYQMPPNSVIPLFDGNEDIMFVKSTDAAGFATIRSFRFEPMPDPEPPAEPRYATLDDLENLKTSILEAIAYGKQSVRTEQPETSEQLTTGKPNGRRNGSNR